jgi:8-oxo-dGTP pyrophosphatase MutT (NUDIX family)
LTPEPTPEPLHQIGALPIQKEGGRIRVLLVTTRTTRRWTIPKGWPMKGLKDHEAAAQEAREEAGIEGRIEKDALGTYLYWKRRETHFDLCQVSVYLLKVEKDLDKWEEQDEREKRWFAVEEAALLVEPELSSLILGLSEK